MPVILYRSWRDFPPDQWRWPSFSPSEIACRGTGQLMIDAVALDRLQALRDRIGKPMIVNSAYRSPEHNRRVGGAKHSQHLYARAFHISMANHDPAAFEEAARAEGFTGFGYYVKQNFMHIDIGPARSWGKPFPPRPVTRRVETDDQGDDLEAERFAEEPKKPTIIETLGKPEVIGPPVTAAVTGWIAKFGDALATSLPLQIAAAVLLVGALCRAARLLILFYLPTSFCRVGTLYSAAGLSSRRVDPQALSSYVGRSFLQPTNTTLKFGAGSNAAATAAHTESLEAGGGGWDGT